MTATRDIDFLSPPVDIPWELVAEHAITRIQSAASALWPGRSVQLLAHVASVTSYVHRVRVDDRDLYAKYSLLGTSLVSVLRGTHGDWPEVLRQQQRYLAEPGGVVDREAAQLRMLTASGVLRMCEPAGCTRGVLFNVAAPAGVPLDQLLLTNPHRAGELLRQAWEPVTRLHTLPALGWPVMPERDVAATFDRKFARPPAGLAAGGDTDAADRLRAAARTLCALPGARTAPVLVFGDAKPEHVIVTDTGPVFLDPGIHVATPAADLAKFVSRCLLLLLSKTSERNTRDIIVAGLAELIGEQHACASPPQADLWLTDLVTILVRDMTNIVSTYLATPITFAPSTVLTARDQAAVIASVIEHAAARLGRGDQPMDVWDNLAREVVAA